MNTLCICAGTGRLLLVAVLFAPSVSAQASTLCAGSCPPDLVIIPPVVGVGPPITTPFPPSLLEITSLTSTGWSTSFGAWSSDPINQVTLPYFSDSQLSSIVTPSGWSFQTGTTDIFGLGVGAGYMEWSHNGLPPVTAPMFGFVSAWAPGLATYKFTSIDFVSFTKTGDIPLSPMAQASGLIANSTAIPLPASFILLLTGIAAIGATAHRKSRVLLA